MSKKIRDYGINIGVFPTGDKNLITDVKGVKVGHSTIDNEIAKTGVTAIIPHEGNTFRDKFIAASHVINGFGKTTGLVQINELGTLETPIILTNTLNIGTAHEALVRYMLKNNDDIGETTGTVNPIICECNDADSRVNDIRGLHVKEEHIYEAIANTDYDFLQGNVGAGTGMVCYGLKSGIGSSSRIIKLDDKNYTLGILVLSNFGLIEDFLLNGEHLGKVLAESVGGNEDKGSIVVILATDIPLSFRQLKRVLKRVHPGIARTGTYTANGSGEIAIGFSTANVISHYEEKDIVNIKVMNDDKINPLFKATVEATEEAILNSLVCSNATTTRDGDKILSLRDFLGDRL